MKKLSLIICICFANCMSIKGDNNENSDLVIKKIVNKDVTVFGNPTPISTLKILVLDKINNQKMTNSTVLINNVPIKVDSINSDFNVKLYPGSYSFEILTLGYIKRKWKLKTNKNYNYDIRVKLSADDSPLY